MSEKEAELAKVDELTSVSSHGETKSTLSTKIRGFIWDSLDKSPRERRYVFKIDCWIMTYVCLSYFIKYLDLTNVSNAYVSGMKEDLAFGGTQYNWVSTWYYIGYIIGQVPSQYAINKIRPSIWLPTMEIIYGIFVMATAAAKNVNTVYVLRFFVGLFESTAYVTIMTLLSNFYLPEELGKRSCIFQTSSSAAQMFSGYLQSGLHSGMNGKGGLASWRWLFIFDGIITIPVAVAGYFCIPDDPFLSRAKWYTESDRELGIERAKRSNRNTHPNIKIKDFIALLSDWPFYLFSLAFTAHVLGIRLYGYMNLWLTSTGDYSVSQVNTLPTAGYGAQIVFTLIWAWLSDAIGSRWPIITLACVPAIIGSIILWVWPEGNNAALFAGWYLLFIETGAGALFISWISETLGTAVEQRYLLIGFVELVSFSFSAAVPIYLWPADQAPKYKYGYSITFMFFTIEALCAITGGVIEIFERRGVLKNKHQYQVYADDEGKEFEGEEI